MSQVSVSQVYVPGFLFAPSPTSLPAEGVRNFNRPSCFQTGALKELWSVGMDLWRLAYSVLLFLASSSSFIAVDFVRANVVFPVEHKFKGLERNLSAFKAHDVRRHGRTLFDVDLKLGGNGQPTETGLVP